MRLGLLGVLGVLLLALLSLGGCGEASRSTPPDDKLYNAEECHRLKKERRYSLIRKPKVCWMFF